MAQPTLTLSGIHPVVITGMDPGEEGGEHELPIVGADDAGQMVRIAFEHRSQVILPTRGRIPAVDEHEAVRVAHDRGGRAVSEFRAHRLLDFDEAYAAGRPAASRPAFRFSLALDEAGETQPDRLSAFNLLLHHRPSDRIPFLEHDYEAPELWGEPGEPVRVVLEEGQTWTSEPVHLLATHRVGDATFAYRLGRRLTGGRMAVNLKPDEDAIEIARRIGAKGLQHVYYVYRVSDRTEATAEGPASPASQSWKIAVPGGANGHQNLPFAPLLVAAVKDGLDHLASLVDVRGVEFTAYEQMITGGSGTAYAPVVGLSEPPPSRRGVSPTGVDVLPSSGPKRRRWSLGR